MNFRSGKRSASSISKEMIPKPLLLVEDSRSVSNIIKTQIEERWHCDVHVAASFEDAVVLLKSHRKEYFLAICDLNLPDAPNGEIMGLIKRTGLPTIIITGSAEKGEAHKNSYSNVVDFILKSQANSVQYLVEQAGRFYFNKFTTLMIVDDSKLSRDMVTQVLSNQNFRVLGANSAEDALVVLKEHPEIKLVVSDYIMPKMNGVQLTTELRKQLDKSKLAIIGLSSDNEPRLGLEFIRNGANDFLTKPFIAEELIMRINQNLDTMNYIEVIENIANRDYLTKLHNRRYFYSKGEGIRKEAARNKTPFTVALLDIDHFKNINDTYGHDIGDKVLIEFASLITNHFSDALTARVGGEEFVIAFSTTVEETLPKLNAFREELASKTYTFDDQSLSVTVSIGCNGSPLKTMDETLKLADEYLYQAKNQGRNRVIHQPSD